MYGYACETLLLSAAHFPAKVRFWRKSVLCHTIVTPSRHGNRRHGTWDVVTLLLISAQATLHYM
jgi:hypothetical protein